MSEHTLQNMKMTMNNNFSLKRKSKTIIFICYLFSTDYTSASYGIGKTDFESKP